MTLRKFAFMVITTIGLGMLIGLLHAASKWFVEIGWFIGMQVGGFVATTALMGFWAYLTLNFIVRGLIPANLWRWMQILLIGIVWIDMAYLPYITKSQPADSVWPYIGFASWPLALALAIAYLKARLSGKSAFVPAVFFLYVFTVIEWYVALKFGESGLTVVIGTVLLACNSYLILLLGKLLKA